MSFLQQIRKFLIRKLNATANEDPLVLLEQSLRKLKHYNEKKWYKFQINFHIGKTYVDFAKISIEEVKK